MTPRQRSLNSHPKSPTFTHTLGLSHPQNSLPTVSTNPQKPGAFAQIHHLNHPRQTIPASFKQKTTHPPSFEHHALQTGHTELYCLHIITFGLSLGPLSSPSPSSSTSTSPPPAQNPHTSSIAIPAPHPSYPPPSSRSPATSPLTVPSYANSRTGSWRRFRIHDCVGGGGGGGA